MFPNHIPSPVHNKNTGNAGSTANYLVIGGKLTREGFDYLKLLNVYSKALRRLSRSY